LLSDGITEVVSALSNLWQELLALPVGAFQGVFTLISVPDVWVCFRCAEIKDQSDGASEMMKKTHRRAHPNIWCSSYRIHGIAYLVTE
jgi:hypothetical protein